MIIPIVRRTALLAGVALGTLAPLSAQDSGALIDLLVRKGIVTDQEAEDLRADLVREFTANTAAGKLNLGSSISEFKLSGDLRLRHQLETQAPLNGTVSNERSRTRFRFRFNGDVLLQRGWGAGFALETAQAADSGNQTFENGNDDYNLYLARAYVSYRPTANLFLVGGKFRNPFYTTDLVWDSDINPQGLAQTYTLPVGEKDTLELRAGQIILDDNNEAMPGPAGRDAYLFSQQLVYTRWFGRNELGNLAHSLVLAPGFMAYNHAVTSGLGNETPFNSATGVPFSGSTDKLMIATFAGEVNVANPGGREGTQLKLYWDGAYNFEAEGRQRRIYGIRDIPVDRLAWLIGVGYSFGSGKTQGDYSLRVDYRKSPLGVLDPNLNDSDFAFGNLNQEGWKLTASYNLTDFASLTTSYFYTTDIEESLQQSAVARLDHAQILQVDLNVKF